VPRKRLVGHGWDLLGVSPTEVARHADALAKTGLDGISLSLRAKLPDGRKLSFSSILTDPPWTREAFADQIAALRRAAGPEAADLIDRRRDEVIEGIVAGWPKSFTPERATQLGFVAETTVDELIEVYLAEDAPGASG
jgi:hypothetical protein